MSKVSKEKSSSLGNAFTVIKTLATIAYSAVGLYAAIKAYKNLPGSVDDFEDIIANWKTKTITDIQLFSDYCPDDYEPAYQDDWPGTIDGCYQFPNLLKGPCSESKQNDFFEANDIPAMLPQYLAIWNSQLICVKRTSEDWATMAGLVVNGQCPTGYLTCGSTSDNIFCTKEASCPLTSMSSVLSAQYGEDVLPLSEFRLAEPDYTALEPRFALLDHLAPRRRLSLWSLAGQIDENTLFKQNEFLFTIIDEFSMNTVGFMNSYYGFNQGFYAGNDRNWTLHTRRYTSWKMSCRDRMQIMINNSGFGPALEKIQLALLIVSCIAFCVLVVALPITKVCYMSLPEDEKKKKEKTLTIIEMVFQFMQLPIQIIAIVVTFSTRNAFVSVQDDNCSDPETNGVIEFLGSELKGTVDDNFIAIGSLAGKMLLDLILYLYKRHKEKRSKNVKVVSPQPQPQPTPVSP